MSTVTRNLQNINGANVTNPTANNFTTNGLAAYANDAAFEAATTPVAGSIYWNTTEKLLREYNGTSWQYDKLAVSVFTDSTTTGTNQDITPQLADQVLRFTQGSLTSIRSILPTNQKMVWLINDQASNGITIVNESASATAANRIRTPSGQDFVLQTNQVLSLAYDDEISRWRVVGSIQTGLESFINDSAYTTAHNPPVAGSRYWNSTSLVVREYDGTAWQNSKFYATIDNSSLTGADQDYTPSRDQCVRLTNSGLTSLRSIDPSIQKFMILINNTTNVLTIKNQDTGATAANRIITGTGSNLSMAADSSILLQYDTVSSRWRVVGGSGGGGLTPTVRSTTFTASPGFHYQTDTSGGAFTATLPSGAAGSIIMFSDSTESWNLFQLTIAPASGQKIDGLANDETLVCDVKRGWVELSWNATGSFWSMRSLSATNVVEASASQAGIVSTGTQTFAGAKTFSSPIAGSISLNSNVRTTDADVTLVSTDNPSQTFTSLTASRAVTLPTTGVLAGDVWRIENTTAFDLVVKSSNGTALTVSGGANVDATHQKGYVVVRALINSPTTPANWLVIDLFEVTSQANASSSGNFTNIGARFTRRMNSIVMTGTETWAVANNTIQQDTASSFVITRMRPSLTTFFGYRSSTGTTWSLIVLSTGVLRLPSGIGPGGTSIDTGSFSWNVA